LIFKGSGFYITDYRDSSYTDKAKAESGESKPAETTASGTGESKLADPKPADAKPAASDSKGKTELKAKAASKPTAKNESPTKPATKK